MGAWRERRMDDEKTNRVTYSVPAYSNLIHLANLLRPDQVSYLGTTECPYSAISEPLKSSSLQPVVKGQTILTARQLMLLGCAKFSQHKLLSINRILQNSMITCMYGEINRKNQEDKGPRFHGATQNGLIAYRRYWMWDHR